MFLRVPQPRLVGRALKNFLVPPVCVGCGEPIAEPQHLCGTCWKEITFITPPLCDRLGIPFPYDPMCTFISPRALQSPPYFNRARAAFLFQGKGRELVHQLKYQRKLYTAPLLARMMASAGISLIHQSDVIVPIPLHWSRTLKRGFNQAARLSIELASIHPLPLSLDVLKRKHRTRSQVGLSARNRQQNVERAFEVDPRRVEEIVGKRVLLIDDVLTSGATANAATRKLLRAGAAEVNLLVAGIVMEE